MTMLAKTSSNLTDLPKPVSLESVESAIGRQAHRRSSQTVTPGKAVGGGGTPIVVKSLRRNAQSSCEIDASQRGQKPLNTEAEEPTTW
jgi:hypothetical protein